MSVTPHVRAHDRGPTRILTVDRPAKKNALARQTIEELAAAIDLASLDGAVRGVVLAAAGDVFMAGGDLEEFAKAVDDPGGADMVIAMGARLGGAIEGCEVPVVAAVSGDVFGGGCEVVLACDAVFADETAGFSFRHVVMGLAPAWGGTSRLLERVGPLEATRLLLAAPRIAAPEAAAIGLVNAAVVTGGALDAAMMFLKRIALHDRAVVAANKRALVEVRSVARAAQAAAEGAAVRALWGQPAQRAALARYSARAK
jgi:enoyl-CoA hydratase/carnithine racemase